MPESWMNPKCERKLRENKNEGGWVVAKDTSADSWVCQFMEENMKKF